MLIPIVHGHSKSTFFTFFSARMAVLHVFTAPLRFEIFPSVHHTSYCIFHHEDLFFSTSADRTIHPSRECLDLPPSYQPIATFTSKLKKFPPIFSFVAAALMECPSQRCLPHVRYPLSWYCRWPREPTDNRKRYLTIIMFVFGAIATKIHIMIFYYQSIKASVRRYNII